MFYKFYLFLCKKSIDNQSLVFKYTVFSFEKYFRISSKQINQLKREPKESKSNQNEKKIK